MAQSPSGIPSTNNSVQSITRQARYEPFELQVSRGQITGHTPFLLYAYSNAIGNTAFGPIWEGLTQSGGLYNFPSSAAQLTIVSTSASDTSALSVQITGLDANFNPLSEIIALNGTTPVTSVNSYYRVNNCQVTNGSNVGTITFKQSTNLLAQINAGVCATEMGIYTVPAGQTLYIFRNTKTANIGFTSSAYMNYQVQYNYNPSGQVLVANQQTFVQQITIDYTAMPRRVPEKTDIQFCIKSSTGGPLIASLNTEGVLISNGV